MACKADYSNTQKYSNRKSFDGQPVPKGNVLVPFLKEKFGFQKGDYIQNNITPLQLGEFSFEIGFMAINEDHYASYMKDFWNELNKDMEMRREGRCIIGKNPNGTDKFFPEPTEEELKIKLLSHFDKENPRYAKIIRLSLQGMSINDICIEINLKSSRGRQEINNAHDAVCEYLKFRHCKKNRK